MKSFQPPSAQTGEHSRGGSKCRRSPTALQRFRKGKGQARSRRHPQRRTAVCSDIVNLSSDRCWLQLHPGSLNGVHGVVGAFESDVCRRATATQEQDELRRGPLRMAVVPEPNVRRPPWGRTNSRPHGRMLRARRRPTNPLIRHERSSKSPMSVRGPRPLARPRPSGRRGTALIRLRHG
jgi:hypothetical protein